MKKKREKEQDVTRLWSAVGWRPLEYRNVECYTTEQSFYSGPWVPKWSYKIYFRLSCIFIFDYDNQTKKTNRLIEQRIRPKAWRVGQIKTHHRHHHTASLYLEGTRIYCIKLEEKQINIVVIKQRKKAKILSSFLYYYYYYFLVL